MGSQNFPTVPFVPQWLTGKHITAITATAMTVDPSTGILAPETAFLLSNNNAPANNTGGGYGNMGVIDSISLSAENVTENISPMTYRIGNEIITETNYSMTLTEILGAGSSNTYNLLEQVANTSDYVMITFNRGVDRVYTGYFVIKGYSEDLVRGKSTGKLTLGVCGNGSFYSA